MKRIVTVVTLFVLKCTTCYPAAGDGVEIGFSKSSALQQFTVSAHDTFRLVFNITLRIQLSNL